MPYGDVLTEAVGWMDGTTVVFPVMRRRFATGSLAAVGSEIAEETAEFAGGGQSTEEAVKSWSSVGVMLMPRRRRSASIFLRAAPGTDGFKFLTIRVLLLLPLPHSLCV